MGFVLGGSLGTKPCVSSGKVALAGDERYLVCAAVLRSFWRVIGSALLVWLQGALCVFVCVRSYRVFWNLGLQIAVEWLHECCPVV